MPSITLILPVLIPAAGGIASYFVKNERARRILLMLTTLLNSACIIALVCFRPRFALTLIHFTSSLSVTFSLDGLGMFYALLLSLLWPAATLYAFGYMKGKPSRTFFTFYTLTYGVTYGIAAAANLITLYIFYEFLTLATFPLVMYGMTRESIRAGRKYLYYSLGGSAFAFIGMAFIISYGNSTLFTWGGVLSDTTTAAHSNLLLIVYVLTFLGFGVKSAVFPLHGWLPDAAVAPTPVTALLHAVAVVKSGVFAIMRVTYYSFGAGFLRGTPAQTIVMCIALFSILYGSFTAARETHLKRRLAYSTVANLSYILFGATLMTPLGLAAAVVHMTAHSFTKITAFFCAGIVMEKTGKEYIPDFDGLAKKLPFTYACFAIASASLVGIPPLACFAGKYMLAKAAIESGGRLELAGIAVLLVSALLCAVYMFTVVVRGAVFPPKNSAELDVIRESGPSMLVPVGYLCACTVVLGLISPYLFSFAMQIGSI